MTQQDHINRSDVPNQKQDGTKVIICFFLCHHWQVEAGRVLEKQPSSRGQKITRAKHARAGYATFLKHKVGGFWAALISLIGVVFLRSCSGRLLTKARWDENFNDLRKV